MKIIWVTNSLLNKFGEYLFGKPSNGVWMDALLEDFNGKKDVEIVIVTTLRTKSVKKLNDGNVTYYALPGGYPSEYNENKKRNIEIWKTLLKEEKPDLIQIWGTEFTHGLCALRAAEGSMPSVIYIQGYVGSIATYYLAGETPKAWRRCITLRDIIKRDGVLAQQRKFAIQAKKEAEMLALSGSIISENNWCDANLKSIVPSLKVYHCPLSINKTFSDYKWEIEKADKYSVICTASGYTIKGLHMLLRAIALLKAKYPEIKLYVPGTPQVSGKSFISRIKKNGYTLYIEKLIKKLGIADNIVWLGRLGQSELAEQYTKRRVFVMPSAIENHSSSLKEAMIVGMPCVSSYVGGIPEYVTHGENGMLYRFEEYAVLADYVDKLFNDDELCKKLSVNASASMSELHNSAIFEKINDIYCDLICKK